MKKYVNGVTHELMIETIKLLEPRLVPSESGVIDLNKEVRETWQHVLMNNIEEITNEWNIPKSYVGKKGIKYKKENNHE